MAKGDRVLLKRYVERARAFEEGVELVPKGDEKKALGERAYLSYLSAAKKAAQLGEYRAAADYTEKAMSNLRVFYPQVRAYQRTEDYYLSLERQAAEFRAKSPAGPPGAKRGKLERTAATTAIIGLLGGLFFLFPNVTGNVTGMNTTNSSSIGIILLAIGLIAGYFWIKRK